jgi:hypothetical protein
MIKISYIRERGVRKERFVSLVSFPRERWDKIFSFDGLGYILWHGKRKLNRRIWVLLICCLCY